MSASGKSSNRHSEYTRGRLSGTGHGPYADQGKRDRKRAQEDSMTNMVRNEEGKWVKAVPMGWQEEHPFLVRVAFRLLGISHCGKKGWRR